MLRADIKSVSVCSVTSGVVFLPCGKCYGLILSPCLTVCSVTSGVVFLPCGKCNGLILSPCLTVQLRVVSCFFLVVNVTG